MATERLKDELANDPEARGYSGMTDAEVLVDINTQYRTQARELIPVADILTALDDADLTALSATAHRKLLLFVSVVEIDISNPRVRAGLQAIFSGRPSAATRLVDLENLPITRAQELKLGVLRPGHIQVARA